MADARFSIEKAFSMGWNTFKSHWALLIGAGVLAFVAYMVPSMIAGALAEEQPGLGALFNIISFALSLVFQIGFTVMALNMIDGKPVQLADLWSHWKLIPRFLGAMIVVGLMVMAGTILLIIPGIYLAVRYQLYTYVVVDKKMGVIDSIKYAGEITKGSWWNLFAFGIIAFLLCLIAFLPFGLGLILAIPVTMLATTSVYRQLTGAGAMAPAAAAVAAPVVEAPAAPQEPQA